MSCKINTYYNNVSNNSSNTSSCNSNKTLGYGNALVYGSAQPKSTCGNKQSSYQPSSNSSCNCSSNQRINSSNGGCSNQSSNNYSSGGCSNVNSNQKSSSCSSGGCNQQSSNSCNPQTYALAPAVGDSQYLINQQVNSQRSCKPKSKKVYYRKQYCEEAEECETWPPPTETDGDINTITLYVGKGGNYSNINEAMKAIPKDNTQKYRLHLQPCMTHNVSISVDCEHNDVALLGDLHTGVGVFYGQNCAMENLSLPYSKAQLRSGNGLGPYKILLNKSCNPCGPFSLSVISQSDADPNFSQINYNYTLIFKHANGTTTKHPVLNGNCSTLTLSCPICIDGCIKDGEGFYLEPNTTLNFCGDGDQTFLMEGSLEFHGFNLTGARQTFIGSTGSTLALRNNVVLMEHFIGSGQLDSPLANVWGGEAYFIGNTGRMISQTWLGSKASLEFTNAASVQVLTSTILQTDKGINILNGSVVGLPYCLLYKNTKALYIGSGSTGVVPGAMFKKNGMGTFVTSNSNLTAEYSLKAPVGSFQTYYVCNERAIETTDSATSTLDVATFKNNKLTFITHGQSQISILQLSLDINTNPYPNLYNPAFNGAASVYIDPLLVSIVYPILPGQPTILMSGSGSTISYNTLTPI